MKNRGDIDGLRAVAVLGVVAYHYGLTAIGGGFVGVDIFFVISGFLITHSLTRDLDHGGSMWLPRFYERRIKRIAPALFTVLAVTLVASAVLLTPGDYKSVGESAAFSAAGIGNVFFYLNTDYFDQSADLQPLLHMWSLGVEEQFYLVWPVALFGIFAVTRAKHASVVALIALLTLASFIFSQYQLSIDPKAAFYLPFARAWELSLGCLMAFAPTIKNRTTANIITAGALALMCIALIATSTSPFPGVAALPAVIGAALIVWPKQPSQMAKILDNKPMRQIGLWSYSLYLWHWPILVLYKHYDGDPSPSSIESLFLAALSLLAAYLTWKYVEPVRYRNLGMLKTIGAGILGTIIVASAGFAVHRTDGLIGRFPEKDRDIATLDEMWAWDCISMQQLGSLKRKTCIFGEPWKTAKNRGIIWGDSHAGHFAPLVEAILSPGTSVALIQPCPAALGGTVRRVHPDLPDYVQMCEGIQQDAIALMNKDKVDWVLLASAWRGLAGLVSADSTIVRTADGIELLGLGLEETIRKFPSSVRVILASQVPGLQVPLPPCELGLLRSACSGVGEQTLKLYTTETKPIDAMIEGVAHATGSEFILPGQKLCGSATCITKVDGEIIYRDTNHIRRNLTLDVRRKIAELVGLSPALLTARLPASARSLPLQKSDVY